MEYVIRLEQHSALPLAVVRRQARSQELAKVVPEACGTVWRVIRAQQVTGAGRHIAVYWDNQINAGGGSRGEPAGGSPQFNLEVGVKLESPFSGSGEVVGSATPGGPVAATTHYGPYSQLHKAHEAIQQWCRTNGRALAGPSWEIYGHWDDEWNRDPTKIRTDVFYLLVEDGSATA